MFCKKCGQEIGEANFCGSCGEKAKMEKESYKNEGENFELNKKIEENISLYLEEQGKKSKMPATEYFTKFKPLTKIRLLCFGIPMVAGLIYAGPILMLFGAVVGVIPYVFVLGGKVTKENFKQSKYEVQENIGEKVFDFIRSNNKYSEIELDEFDKDEVRIKFKNQSYHKIVFNQEKGVYQIIADRCTVKQSFKSASSRPSNILFRNSKHVNPVLKAMVDTVVGLD